MEQLFAVAGSALIGWFIGPILIAMIARPLLRPILKPIFYFFEKRKVTNRKLSIDEQCDEELQELLCTVQDIDNTYYPKRLTKEQHCV